MQIIAEIGWNHLGDMELASKMIEAAARSGATHAKFQTWKTSRLKTGPWDSDGRREIYEKAQLTDDSHHFLVKVCSDIGIKFLTSCFSARDVEFIFKISDEIKVASTEILNEELLLCITRELKKNVGRHVYISTGTCTLDEVGSVVNQLRLAGVGHDQFTLMHCVSSYPVAAESCNMMRIPRLKQVASRVGYSGHFNGIEDALVAVHLDVDAIEKHFTIDRSLPGRDNAFAVLPEQLEILTRFVRFRDDMLYGSMPNIEGIQECERASIEYRGRWDAK